MGGTQTKAIPHVHLPNNYGWIPNVIREFDLQKNKVLNEYKSLDRLGKGGYGTVLKVEHVGTRVIYALKYIPINEDYEKAIREAEVMKKVSHKSIVRVHSAFSLYEKGAHDPIAYCIVMDFVEGSDLRDYMQRLSRPLPKNYVMECFIKLTEALNYLHQQGIYHCDLKPENIIVCQSDQGVNVTIVDFGSAGVRAGHAVEGGSPLQGTIAYMAPELIKSRNVVLNGKADMWALGCILYEIWTQDSSFVTESYGMATKLGKDRELITKLEDLAIVQLLTNLLHPDPGQRITAEKLLNSDIFRGWRVAIDESHTDRATFPSSALFLFPFITVLNFNSSQPSLCLSNLQYITQWLRIKDFHRVFVEFNCSLSLIKFISQSTEPESIMLALNILTVVLLHEYGTTLAYQICANQIGIATLLKKKGLNEILKLLRFSFGHATLKRCFAIDNLVFRLLHSNQLDNIKVGRGLYEDLQDTTVPLSLYLDKLSKITTEPSIKISFISDLMNNHKDIPALLNASAAGYDKMEKLLCSCLSFKSEHTPRLLSGLLFMVKPSSSLTRCINHRVCTAEITGSVKYPQYVWYCEECKLHACVGCAKNCHSGCTGGYFYQGSVGCTCALEGYCKCVRHSFDEVGGRARSGTIGESPTRLSPVISRKQRSNSQGDAPARTQRFLRNCVFNLYPFVAAPYSEPDYGSLLRYWEATDELKLPPFSTEEKAKNQFMNKGFVLSKPKNSELTTVFYYEIEILAPPVGRNASIAMGVLLPYRKDYDFSTRPLGLAEGEYGYHGHDGQAFYAENKVPNYGPIYSTGDRIGCGVLSDGAVYFTLNGIWLGCPIMEMPKIALGSPVCSIVTTNGFDAHIKFIFEPNSFMFVPEVQEFEVPAFFKGDPYVHLPILRAAFGDNEARVFELLKSVEFDLGASLLHALCFNNTRFARELSKIFNRFSDSSSRFSRFMMELIYEIQNTKPEPRQPTLRRSSMSVTAISGEYTLPITSPISPNPRLTGLPTTYPFPHSPPSTNFTPLTSLSHSLTNSLTTLPHHAHAPASLPHSHSLADIPHTHSPTPSSPTPLISSPPATSRTISPTPTSEKLEKGEKFEKSDSLDSLTSPRERHSSGSWIRRQPSREITSALLEEVSKQSKTPTPLILKKTSSITRVPFYGDSGNVPPGANALLPVTKSKSLFASNELLQTSLTQKVVDPQVQYALTSYHTQSTPLTRRQDIYPSDYSRHSHSPLSSLSSSSSSTSSTSPTPSPGFPPPSHAPLSPDRQRLSLSVCLSSDESDKRELILDPEQQTFEGLKAAFVNEAFAELKNVVVYKIHKVDKEGEVVRLTHDKSIEALKGHEKLVFYVTYN